MYTIACAPRLWKYPPDCRSAVLARPYENRTDTHHTAYAVVARSRFNYSRNHVLRTSMFDRNAFSRASPPVGLSFLEGRAIVSRYNK